MTTHRSRTPVQTSRCVRRPRDPLQGSGPGVPGLRDLVGDLGFTGTFSDVNDPNAFVSGLSVGQNLFQWQVYNSHCGSGVTSDIVRVFLFDLNAPRPMQVPTRSSAVRMTRPSCKGMFPTPPAVGVWTVVQGTANIANINNPNTPVSGLTIGRNDPLLEH